ncbi:MAG: lipopolysaccharide heptosyltransferase II [Elusimicrobia bacterium]|nr:lipopolysaccharide heptosyltransferase II [Candidatus Obscuribacterium magneticum]
MRILVIRFSSLGDVVLTTAIFPNLKAHWPAAEVTVLTRRAYADVFDGNPYVDHVRVFDPREQPFSKLTKEVREEGFDLCIDLQGNVRSFLVRMIGGVARAILVEKSLWARWALVWFKRESPSLRRSVREKILDCLGPLGVGAKFSETQLFPSNTDAVLTSFEVDPSLSLIGLAPGAKHATKRWNPEKFAEAANRLGMASNKTVLILGDKSDRPIADKVAALLKLPFKNLAGWTNLKELIAVVSKLSVLVTNDSGLLHIAEAMKIPLVAVFGPTVPAFGFAPYRDSSHVAELPGLSCRPCTLHGDEICPLKHHRCMEDLMAENVLETLQSRHPRVGGDPGRKGYLGSAAADDVGL